MRIFLPLSLTQPHTRLLVTYFRKVVALMLTTPLAYSGVHIRLGLAETILSSCDGKQRAEHPHIPFPSDTPGVV